MPQQILLFSAIPVLTMLAGGLFAAFRKPGGGLRSLLLHFAAGVVFSVVAVEILPDVVRLHQPWQTILGFVAGFLVMVGVRKFTAPKEDVPAGTSTTPVALLIAVGVDIFIDGLLLGIAFHAGSTEGALLAIALSLELLSLGMATATELRDNQLSKQRTLVWISLLAAIFFASALLGASLLNTLPEQAMNVLLSFGLSALLFLVTEELLTEAHEEKETIWQTSAFFIGFLLFLILGMYV